MEFKAVVCNIDNQLFGFDINVVQGIEKEQQIVPVPNSASYIKGIMNLRGDIIPIFSLRNKFGMPDKNDNMQFIIVNVKGTPLAIEVDAVGEIYTADDTNMYDTPKIVITSETQYINKVIKTDKKLILIVDINNVLTADELTNINGFVDSLS